MTAGEVVASTRVALGGDAAFRVFTDDIDRWWRRDPARPDAVVQFQGDRLISVSADGAELVAEVARWRPPTLVELRWLGPHAKDGDVVVLEFAPDRSGTRVTVRHRQIGMASGRAGTGGAGLWWADLLRRFSAAHPSSTS